MSARILQHSILGTFDEIKYVRSVLPSNQPSKREDIRKICTNKSVGYFHSFNGILALLEFIGLLKITDESILESVNTTGIDTKSSLLELFLHKLEENRLTEALLAPPAAKYDYVNKRICVIPSLLDKSLDGIKNLLVDLGYLTNLDPSGYTLMVGELYFHESIKSIKEGMHRKIASLRTLSKEDLMALLAYKDKLGFEAEQAVLGYELKRLTAHPQKDEILIISEINISAGYDLISFNSRDSRFIDRFIEVKSYTGRMGFYISRNELATAELKGESYYLYLVDRNKIGSQDLAPTIIQDPYKNIFKSKSWRADPESWHFVPLE